jgi:hypothetical protein
MSRTTKKDLKLRMDAWTAMGCEHCAKESYVSGETTVSLLIHFGLDWLAKDSNDVAVQRPACRAWQIRVFVQKTRTWVFGDADKVLWRAIAKAILAIKEPPDGK